MLYKIFIIPGFKRPKVIKNGVKPNGVNEGLKLLTDLSRKIGRCAEDIF